MKHIIFLINYVNLLKYVVLSEEKKIRYLKKLKNRIVEQNKISKALEETNDFERSFVCSSVAWLLMSEYCMYCKKEGIDIKGSFNKKSKK